MKTLDEHDAERSAYHGFAFQNTQVRNNIACPKCGEELYDSNPSMTLTSFPPRKSIHCGACDFKDTRIA